VDALVRVVPPLAGAGIALVPQGASLSYSGGTLALDRSWVALDLTGLGKILEVNAEDRYLRVEAGCTWATLDQTLEPLGLRTPFWGPASGLHATIGGSLAADALFFGSAHHGPAAASVLGLTVLLADGRLVRTGSLATGGAPTALPFGPDLTRLFVGSCGALGVIVEAALPLITRPLKWAVAGYACPDAESAVRVLARLAAAHVASEVLLFDPSVTSMLAGEAATARLAAGRRAAPDSPYSLNLAVEGATEEEVERQLARAREVCLASGATSVGAGLLAAFRVKPFQPPQMLRTARGRRWVPVHGVLPHSKVLAALRALDRCAEEHHRLIDELGLDWTCTCALIGRGAVLVEANLYWPDAGNLLIDHYLGVLEAGVTLGGRWQRVQPLRAAFASALGELGAIHMQLGRFYEYLSRLDPPAREILESFKRLFDPQAVMNPGVLGLSRGREA
jgi:FAD/FMN-containing dehydrogenase